MSNDFVLRRKSLKTQPSPHSLVCSSLYFLFHAITITSIIIIVVTIIIVMIITSVELGVKTLHHSIFSPSILEGEVMSCKLWDGISTNMSFHHGAIITNSWSSPPLSSSRGSPPSPPTTAKAQGVGRGECLNNFPDKTSPSLWPDRASQRPNSSLSSEYSNNHYHQNTQVIIIIRKFK